MQFMLFSLYEAETSPRIALTRADDFVGVSFRYYLESSYSPVFGDYSDGDISAGIGNNGGYKFELDAQPLDLAIGDSFTPGETGYCDYIITDALAGLVLESEFSITIFDEAADFVGTALADAVFGSAFADTFRSVGDGDAFEGGAGDDLYRVYSADTQVIETAGAGDDRVAVGVSYELTSASYVELLTTTSTASTWAINLTGNEFAQEIVGNAGDNRLEGEGGADTLRGLGGKDTFVFATALGGGNIDTITDFNRNDDRFLLSDAIFTALSPGTLAASAFRSGITGLAEDADDRIIYQMNTGKLFYDADGYAPGEAVHFATIGTAIPITNVDFSIA